MSTLCHLEIVQPALNRFLDKGLPGQAEVGRDVVLDMQARILEYAKKHLKLWWWGSLPKWRQAKGICTTAEELGFAWKVTREPNFTYRAAELLAEVNRLLLEKNSHGMPLYDDIFVCELALSLIYLHEYFGEDWGHADSERLRRALLLAHKRILQVITEKEAYKVHDVERSAWNHSMIVHAIFGMMCLKLKDAVPRWREDLTRALIWVNSYLNLGYTANGVCREGTFYAGFSRPFILMFAVALREIEGIDLLRNPHLRRSDQWLCDEFVPTLNRFVVRNDAAENPATSASGLVMFSHLLQSGKALGIWSRLVGRQGTNSLGDPRLDLNGNGSLVLNLLYWPERVKMENPADFVSAFALYKDEGLVFCRSKDDKFYLTFQAPHYFSKIHSQADHGSLYLFSKGDRLLIDAGPADDRAENSPSQSVGHSFTLLIGGKGMSQAGKGWQTVSNLRRTRQIDDFVLTELSLTCAYSVGRWNMPVEIYERCILASVSAPYLLMVVDWVVPISRQNNRYEYVFHTDCDNDVDTSGFSSILIKGKFSKLRMYPTGFSLDRVVDKLFEYEGAARSRIVRASFETKEFLGGWIGFVAQNDEDDNVVSESSASGTFIRTESFQAACRLIRSESGGPRVVLSIEGDGFETRHCDESIFEYFFPA